MKGRRGPFVNDALYHLNMLHNELRTVTVMLNGVVIEEFFPDIPVDDNRHVIVKFRGGAIAPIDMKSDELRIVIHEEPRYE